MTINDQIRDEKLQYDINREAAKISASSSGKIHEYEYLTGQDILPYNQQQIIEQAKFTYSVLGKAFEKQIKTIEDQHKKQVDALKYLNPKAITYKSDDDNATISKEIYNEILEKRMDEILEMSREINYSNLVYDFKSQTHSISFSEFGGPIHNYKQLKNGEKTLQQIEKNLKKFKSELNEIKSGNPKHKSDKQLYAIKNIRTLYDSRKKLLICLMIMQKLDLKPFTNKNKIKQKEQDLKY